MRRVARSLPVRRLALVMTQTAQVEDLQVPEGHGVPIYSWWSYVADPTHWYKPAVVYVLEVSYYGCPDGGLELQYFVDRDDENRVREIPEELKRITVKQFWELADAGKLKRIDGP